MLPVPSFSLRNTQNVGDFQWVFVCSLQDFICLTRNASIAVNVAFVPHFPKLRGCGGLGLAVYVTSHCFWSTKQCPSHGAGTLYRWASCCQRRDTNQFRKRNTSLGLTVSELQVHSLGHGCSVLRAARYTLCLAQEAEQDAQITASKGKRKKMQEPHNTLPGHRDNNLKPPLVTFWKSHHFPVQRA